MKGMEGIPALNFKQTHKPNTKLKQWNVTERIYTPVLSFRIHFSFHRGPLYYFAVVIRRVVGAVIPARKFNIIVNGKNSFRWIDFSLFGRASIELAPGRNARKTKEKKMYGNEVNALDEIKLLYQHRSMLFWPNLITRAFASFRIPNEIFTVFFFPFSVFESQRKALCEMP